MVPMRAIFEALGAQVRWDGANQTAIAAKGEKQISLIIGSPTAYNWFTPIQLDQPPLILNGSTMVPVRFVSEALGCGVSWDALTNTVSIIRNDLAYISPTETSDRSVWKDVNGEYDNYNVDVMNIPGFPHKEEAFASLSYETAKEGDEYLYLRRNVLVGPDGAPGDQTNDDFAVFDKPQWGLDSIGGIADASIKAAEGNYASGYVEFFKLIAGDSELLNHYRVTVYHLIRYHLYDKAKTIYHLPGNSCNEDLLFDTSGNNSITYLGNVYVKENCSWIGIYDDRDSGKILKVLSGKWIPVCQSSLYQYGFEWEGEPYLE